jgi:hypothetical protein
LVISTGPGPSAAAPALFRKNGRYVSFIFLHLHRFYNEALSPGDAVPRLSTGILSSRTHNEHKLLIHNFFHKDFPFRKVRVFSEKILVSHIVSRRQVCCNGCSEKAKPVARRGRKAAGFTVAQNETAGLPGRRQSGFFIDLY